MISIQIKTDDFVEKRLKNADSKLVKNLNKALKDAARTIQATAIKGIQRGKKTGITYKRRGIEHQASAPGEYPASDSGKLASHIRVENGYLEQDIGTDLKYGGYLEDGTSKMKPRPWLMPSYVKNEEIINGLIEKAIDTLFEE